MSGQKGLAKLGLECASANLYGKRRDAIIIIIRSEVAAFRVAMMKNKAPNLHEYLFYQLPNEHIYVQ